MTIFYCHAYIEDTRHTNKHSPWKILISNTMQQRNFTWHTGLDALAYVPQYLLYKVSCDVKKNKRDNENEKKNGKCSLFSFAFSAA